MYSKCIGEAWEDAVGGQTTERGSATTTLGVVGKSYPVWQ